MIIQTITGSLTRGKYYKTRIILLKTQKNIIATLAYFDMFDYPLTYQEIFLFIQNKLDFETLKTTLQALVNSGMIFQFEEFYSLKNDPLIASRRRMGNQKAAGLIAKAHTIGRFLIQFPYVRGIAVSGSLSKNFADDHSDIDFFIITKQNRLWIARTCMHCFKKLTFLVKKQHYYCMNYYIDEQELEIVEKNIYTAIELATLIPLEGNKAFAGLYEANLWVKAFLPHHFNQMELSRPLRKNKLKNIGEKLFNNAFGNWMENILMKMTAKRWNQKTLMKKLNARGMVMSMAASKHFAKPNPKNFQFKLIEKYQNKLADLLKHITAEEFNN